MLGVPCITLRNTTEVIETVKEGLNILTDVDINKILNAVENFNPKTDNSRKALGEGNAAFKIAQVINDFF